MNILFHFTHARRIGFLGAFTLLVTSLPAQTTPTAAAPPTSQLISVSATRPASALPQIRSNAEKTRIVLDADDPAAIAEAVDGPWPDSPKDVALKKAQKDRADALTAETKAKEILDLALEAKGKIPPTETVKLAEADKKLAELKTAAESATALVATQKTAVAAAEKAMQKRTPFLLIDKVPLEATIAGYAFAEKKVVVEVDRLPDDLRKNGNTREVSVSLDYTPQRIPAIRGSSATLIVIDDGGRRWAWGWGVVILLVVVGLGWTTSLLRDRGQHPPANAQPTPLYMRLLPQFIPAGQQGPPFSLARCQMAFWTVLVAWGWLYLWLATRQSVSLSDSVLALLGIASGTMLGARVIDVGKGAAARELGVKVGAQQGKVNLLTQQSTQMAGAPPAPTPLALLAQTQLPLANAELLSLQQQHAQALAGTKLSEGLIEDLLSDEAGVSVHRLQMVIWTAVLGIFFIRTVLGGLAMPEIHGTLLALMGLSCGTYLGFKLPEKA